MDTETDIFQDEDGRFCLTIRDSDERTTSLFEDRGLQGGGYTWEGIVTALVELKLPKEIPLLEIGAEADNMFAYCQDRAILERIADLVQSACADHQLLNAAIDHAGEDLE
jgi:Immunity protein 51